jgi:gamma-glutamylcyclotransferase (GGCT)/AIG2-like uncharacterized protein YtfP
LCTGEDRVPSTSPDLPAPSWTLFVYGTLRRGGRYHRALAGQRFLRPASTAPRYALLDLGDYPGLVHLPDGGQAVEGELYEIATGLRPELDAIEGAPDLFRLGPVAVEGFGGPAWAYFYQPPATGLPLHPAGRWPGGPER